MDFNDLKHKTVGELRELAHQYEDIKGASGMKKEDLIDLLCQKMGIEKVHALPKGIGRHAMKARIKAIKERRDAALASGDRIALRRSRALLRRAKHHIRDIVEHARQAEAKTAPKTDEASPAS